MNKIICSRCVLDNETPNSNLVFNEFGVCNNCLGYDKTARETILRSDKIRAEELSKIIANIKKGGQNKKYDCILGISGGVDSTYLAIKAKEYGLRPLVVHFDNGWNSSLAVKNVYNIVEKLGFELHTYVVDWEEFKDLQLSYLKASVIDIDVPTDHFIIGTLYKIAFENRIRYILDGVNIATEFSNISLKWGYDKTDLTNLLNIQKEFGNLKLRNFPKIGILQRFFYTELYGIKSVSLLNYLSYNYEQVKSEIAEKVGWVDYGGKHYESLFTKFYQGNILPNKFKIDKRKLHLSNLIWSGQISREIALKKLSEPPYALNEQIKDKEYFLKKIGLNTNEFEIVMNSNIVPHEDYGTEKNTTLYKILNIISTQRVFIRSVRFIIRLVV